MVAADLKAAQDELLLRAARRGDGAGRGSAGGA
jgi:hypothetical protein